MHAFLQETLRREFHDVTLITVAHRLNTVMDYDRIAVMGSGKVLEAGVPHELLENEDSALSSLVAFYDKEANERFKTMSRESSTKKFTQMTSSRK